MEYDLGGIEIEKGTMRVMRERIVGREINQNSHSDIRQ